jgi:hypothetical protein
MACDEQHPSGECSIPRQQLIYCSCGGNHTANYRGSSKCKEAKAALTKRTPTPRVHTNGATGRSASAQVTRTDRSAEQKNFGLEWSHVLRGERVMRHTNPSQPEPTH